MSENKQFIGTLPSRLDLGQAGANVDLEKGHLIEAFSYGGGLKDLTLKKTGKQIKDAMDKAIAYESAELIKYQAILNTHKVKDIEPKGNISEYRTRGYAKSSFESLPKVYSYRQKYPEDYTAPVKQESSIITAGFDQPKQVQGLSEEVKNAMREYNNCADKIVECMVEIKIAETVKNGMEENKTYELSVKQAGALGF